MEHRRMFALFTVVLVLLGLVLGACGPGGVEMEATPYDGGSYTIKYPKGWQYDTMGGQAVFYETREAVEKGEGIVVLVMVAPLPPEAAGVLDPKGLLELAAQSAGGQFTLSNVSELTVGGKQAAAADISGTEGGRQLAGRMVLVLGDPTVFMMGAGLSSAWGGFSATFQAMVDSTAFK